jgi:hypothetical protein
MYIVGLFQTLPNAMQRTSSMQALIMVIPTCLFSMLCLFRSSSFRFKLILNMLYPSRLFFGAFSIVASKASVTSVVSALSSTSVKWVIIIQLSGKVVMRQNHQLVSKKSSFCRFVTARSLFPASSVQSIAEQLELRCCSFQYMPPGTLKCCTLVSR